jgi:ABC-2 type transport system permease protein
MKRMPIYDLGYRHWSGAWTSHPYRWWVITRQGISLLIRKKPFLILMILSMLPFLVRSVMIYVSSAVGRNVPLLTVNAKFFEDFLSQQMFFAFIIATYAGAGLISNDLKANALQIYLSKPITRQDYLMGKLGVLVFFLTLPTLLPALVLYLLAILFQANLAYLGDNPWIPASIVGYSLAIVFTYALIMLALSSLTRSSRFAGVNFAAVFFFSQILYGILSQILRTNAVAWVSLGNNLTQVGDFFFRVNAHFRSPTWLSALLLIGVMATSAWLVHNRVKAVEVVS